MYRPFSLICAIWLAAPACASGVLSAVQYDVSNTWYGNINVQWVWMGDVATVKMSGNGTFREEWRQENCVPHPKLPTPLLDRPADDNGEPTEPAVVVSLNIMAEYDTDRVVSIECPSVTAARLRAQAEGTGAYAATMAACFKRMRVQTTSLLVRFYSDGACAIFPMDDAPYLPEGIVLRIATPVHATFIVGDV